MTDTLDARDFAEFTQALWGHAPFPWQSRLAASVVEHDWPSAIDLPTATGKTAAIDVAVFHLAMGAIQGPQRQAPLRIVFVVDRRLVVDDAFRRAQLIADKLLKAKDGILGVIANRLRTLAGSDEPPLRAVRLRGGMPMEPDWARIPCQPTVCVSTVDQVGSRLLFRGYGVSQSMRPIHAGLLGSDALFLLDEAHLSEPFIQTLGWITRYQSSQWVQASGAPFKVVSLSATLSDVADRPFSLSPDDLSNPELRARLSARKHAHLHPLKQEIGSDYEQVADHFAAAAVQLSPYGEGNDDVSVIATVVNRVGLARAVHDSLRRNLRSAARQSAETVLLIGRTRDIDREALLAKFLPRMRAQGRQDGPCLFVVATQCIEAGADLDFDALVTQIAPLDCLRQRFGRLDRLGRRGNSQAKVLAAADELGKRVDDPIYGGAAALTWTWLTSISEGKGKAKFVDFGVEALHKHLPIGQPADPELLAPRKSAPILLPAYVDLWSQTSPPPAADPEPALFLHGPETGPADVTIVWRADFSPDGTDPDEIASLLTALPPSSLESLSVPIWVAKSWLSDLRPEDFADVEGLGSPPEQTSEKTGGMLAFRWRGVSERKAEFIRADEIWPGDVVVVPAAVGGCDEFGWNPVKRTPVHDIGEEAALRHRRRLVVRLLRPLISQHLELEGQDDGGAITASRLWANIADVIDSEPDDDRALLVALLDVEGLPRLLRARLEVLSHVKIERIQLTNTPGCVLMGRRPLSTAVINRLIRDPALSDDARGLLLSTGQVDQSNEPSTESDQGSFLGHEISLTAHSAGVRDFARDFAIRSGLPDQLVERVALAGHLHDLGKAEPRFQAWLRGGDELSAIGLAPLAKSGGRYGSLAERRMARTRSGFPEGGRHECWSVRFAESHPDVKALPDDDRDLVLWLVGTHHGWGRPFFPPVLDTDASGKVELEIDGQHLSTDVDHKLTSLDSGWVERFERLKRRFGPWELARLEAILRLADHRRSEMEQERTTHDIS